MTTPDATAQTLIRLLSIFQLGSAEEVLDRVTDELLDHLDADAVAIIVGSETRAQSGCSIGEQQIVDAVVAGAEIDAPPHVLHLPLNDQTEGSLVALRRTAPFTADEAMSVRAIVRMMGHATRTADAVDEAQREASLAYDDVQWRATHDLVTGLHNRVSFVARMDQSLSTGQAITVLYIDLDGFKTINDHYGHATGDRVLVETAERLRSELSEGTTMARLAGDEFAILMHATTNEAVATAERLHARLGQPIAGTETETALVTASIGIAHGIPGWSAEDILDAADIAMYSSKQQQGGTVTVFDNALRTTRNRRIQIEQRLKAASVTMEGFHLAFHPITDLITGERPSLEALLRWDDAELGPVSPDEFIGIAEQAGLIRDIDSWVISTAIEEIADLPDNAEIGLSLNLSPASFDHPDLIGMLAELLIRNRFEAHRLTIEITERVLLHDLNRVVPVLDRLHRMGIKIALDDFGAGHSSFTHLQSNWIDVLKIDRSILPTSEHDTRAISILRALRSLCTELDLEVIIEGVDSEFQRSTIRSLGFRLAQGFLWGRPATLDISLSTPNRHLRPVSDQRSA